MNKGGKASWAVSLRALGHVKDFIPRQGEPIKGV